LKYGKSNQYVHIPFPDTKKAGYRAIDSAQMYHNEHEVGVAIKNFLASPANKQGLKRKDVWFTTKLASNSSYDAARKSIKQSIEKSGLDYIDLFLIHSPYGGKKARLESWRAVEDAIEDGEVRTGGISNFGVKHVSLSSLNRTPDPSLFQHLCGISDTYCDRRTSL